MKKLMGAAAIALLLAGCNDETQIAAGDYLFENMQIAFDNSEASSTETGREEFQKRLVSVLNEEGKEIYHSVTPTEIITYGFGVKESDSIVEGRVKIQDVWYSIQPDGTDTLRLISDKDADCDISACQLTVTLKKVAADSPDLLARQQQHANALQAWEKRMADERDEFMRIPMPDVPGTLFTPVEGFTLKLPWRFQDEASQENIAEGYRLHIDRLKIEHVNQVYYSERRKNVEAFFSDVDDDGAKESTEEHTEKALERHADKPDDNSPLVWGLRNEDEGLNLIFNVARGKKEDIDLTRWLAAQNEVIFRSQNGAVYYDEDDILRVIYLQYNEATQHYFVGVGTAKSIAAAARSFAILRTVDARYRGNDIVTLDELTLPQAQQEARYQTTLEKLVDIADLHKDIRRNLDSWLIKPYLFLGDRDSFHTTRINIKSRSFGSRSGKIEFFLDTRPIPELMAEAQKQNPEGKVSGDLFIYGERYNYYRDTGNGMTLVFRVPEDIGNPVVRIMLLSGLRQFDMTTLRPVPAAERKNLLKYSNKYFGPGEPNDRFFVVYEGIIDSQGNLIVPAPEDGWLEFEDRNPWLLVQKRGKEGKYKGRITPEGFVYDAQGKLQFYTANFGELIDNRLVVGGDGKKQGIYDLNTRRWLATGQRIEFVKETGHLQVTDEKGNVRLIDRQGRVLKN